MLSDPFSLLDRHYVDDLAYTSNIVNNSDTGLKELIIPKTVNKIGYRAFYGQNNLVKIKLEHLKLNQLKQKVSVWAFTKY